MDVIVNKNEEGTRLKARVIGRLGKNAALKSCYESYTRVAYAM